MEIRSAKSLTYENCLMLNVYVLLDKDTDEYLSTFELLLPEEEIELDQYDALIEGLEYATFKINGLLEELEIEVDDLTEDGSDD